ncbi:class I adenylate-forming enzyme family protein [Paraburkholderia acidiphila]|uniref:AMP-binding protein n=1 Tax=Paraburkholderia acidiphila TaxID=2571747 RepID=A0A7Z2JDR8_9BURK|nr:AMP-binding protein [Paraburkholderia acidiphila]QGZ59679.1 AMP-binding protein [Paraburkholderia acidiphila]
MRATGTYRPYVDCLLDEFESRADRPVIRYEGTNVTGRALSGAVSRYARALEALGIDRGSLVALFAPNRPDAIAIRYAANLIGAAAIYLPAVPDAGRRAALLARIEPALLVVFPETARLVPETSGAPGTTPLRVMQVGFGSASTRLDVLAHAQPDTPLPGRSAPDELAVIASSGGTTGVPKCSCRSFAAYSALVNAPRDEQRRQLVNGPLAYLSQVLVDTTLTAGGTVVLERRYNPAATLAAIEVERVTDLLLVEPQLFETMDHRDAPWRDLSSLRSIAHVSGSAPAVLRRRAIARFGPVLTHLYGASEAGIVSMLAPHEPASKPALLDCAGRVRDGVDVQFRRTDGTLAAPGKPGKIEVRSAAVAQGYWNQPQETALKFRNGWCLTGDMGFIDKEGYLHVLGRASDIRRIAGRTIAPVDIEEVLCRLPDVRYATAFASGGGFSDDLWHAVVEPWAGRRVDVVRCLRALDAAFGETVASQVRLTQSRSIALTEQGKVDRNAIMRAAPLRGPADAITLG